MDDSPVALGAPKQRALAGGPALSANEVVARERLIDELWGGTPPRSAAQSLQVYVHGLRQALGADRIETHGTGYRLRVEPGELDLERFERWSSGARRSRFRAAARPTRRRTCGRHSASGAARRSPISAASRLRRRRQRGSRTGVCARSSC